MAAVALLMIDVDHFKIVNDQYGHANGDLALKLIADALRNNIRAFDSVARYGGEEFVVVMPGANPEDASAAAERLRISVEAISFEPHSGLRHELSVSVGVSCSSDKICNPKLLLQTADLALYEAKRQGRNRVEVAPLAHVG